MEIDDELARVLGFPKADYRSVERERRWLCDGVPHGWAREAEAICDLYVAGTRLRLREARPIAGGEPRLRLTRKADVDARTRLITSIYLPEEEFRVLAATLPGNRIRKLRNRLFPVQGVTMSVDAFQEDLAGLILAEAEFETPELMAGFVAPEFCRCEVTDDVRYTGAALAARGGPAAVTQATGCQPVD